MLMSFVCLLMSCGAAKELAEGETFLFNNKVTIKSDAAVDKPGELKYELESFYKQKRTRTFIGIPRHTFYYLGTPNPDSTKFRRWLQVKLGDPPVIYSQPLAEQTAEIMENYLAQRGYRFAEVSIIPKSEEFETTTIYVVNPKKRLILNEMIIFSRDTAIQRILSEPVEEPYLHTGAPLDIRLYNEEKNRIARLLQNNGYPFIFQNYITNIEADSTGGSIRAVVEVRNPTDSTMHQKYRNGTISIYQDYALKTDAIYKDSLMNGIRFYSPSYPMMVKPLVIRRNIFIESGDLYRKKDVELTSRQLSKLDIFKFASVKTTIDTTEEGILNYSIFLTRNKKMSLNGDIELNYSNIAARRSLIGTAFNIGYRHRNLLKGAEYFTSNLETGFEFNLGGARDTLLNSINVNFINSLDIPRFIDPTHLYDKVSRMKFGKKRLFGNKLNGWLKEESTTNVSLGINFLSLLNFYDYVSINASFGYDIQPEANKRILINHTGINYFNPDIKPRFQMVLNSIRFLEESFGKQLFTGIFFRDYSYTLNKEPNRKGYSWGIQHGFEISGLEIFALNQAYNGITGGNKEFQLIGRNETTEFSKFMKFNFTYTLRKTTGLNSQLAFKFNSGLAFPYGPYSQQVPYVKQFFVGGALSNRAWVIRELGPGGYNDLNPISNPNNPFYQSGDVLLDMSVEYRFNLFWRFNSAIFLDAANVWTIKNDPERPQANFTSEFVDQIALGYGFGVRFDFTYFLLRLDFGYKLRSPFKLENGTNWYENTFKDFPKGGNPNFAVNYPF